MTRRDKERYAPWLLLIATLLLWELICRGFNVSEFIFPSPSRIASQLWEFRGVIAGHAWRTYWVTMVGFGISIVVGTLLGFLIGSSRTAYAAIYPLMTGFNALPKAAFVPILVATPPNSVREGPYVWPKGPYPHIQSATGRPESMMWVREREDGGRGFGFTGGHFHRNWVNPDFRKVVLNGLLWIAKVEVPEGGAETGLAGGEIDQNLDPKKKN